MSNLSFLEDNEFAEKNEEITPRKSLSQPSLYPNSRQTSSGSQQDASKMPKSVPILQTWRENEDLKGQIYTLRCEVQMYEHKYLVAKNTMHQSVQEVLDDYVKLKLKEDEMAEKCEEFQKMNQELITLREKLEDSDENLFRKDEEIQMLKEEFNKKLKETEEHFNAIISNQQSTNESMLNSTVGSIKQLDLKQGDPNFTIVSWEDKKIMELEYKLMDEQAKVVELEKIVNNLREDLDEKSARLADTENQKAQLIAAAGGGVLGAVGADISRTFVLGNARDSITSDQLKYIDELEKNLKEKTLDLERTTEALGLYMNKVSKLEKELTKLKKNTTLDSSSILIEGKTADELKNQICRVNTELNVLRNENRDLRSRCDRLQGGTGRASISFDENRRLCAGISPELGDVSQAHATHGDNEREEEDDDEEEGGAGAGVKMFKTTISTSARSSDQSTNENYLMDSTTARRIDDEDNKLFNEAMAEFENMLTNKNDTIESTFSNSTMPPPDRSQTELFLKMKNEQNSPQLARNSNFSLTSQTSSAVTTIPAHESSRLMKERQQMHQNDGSLLHEVQQILDTSQALIEGSQSACADIDKMRDQMQSARSALARLFERLKSSAALFEEILEKMGSSSPLAERIRQMKLAFESSMYDHADVSQYIEAAENELANLSVNFSMLEKSIVGQSFDVSRRFSIVPSSEDIQSSSLLNPSYSPIFNFGAKNAKHEEEVEKLRLEIVELKEELDKAKNASMRLDCVSPGLNTSLQRQLCDVQLKAAQNFENLEVCQATLKRVENEKATIEKELKKVEEKNVELSNRLIELEDELIIAQTNVEKEATNRKLIEEELRASLKRTSEEDETVEALLKQREADIEVLKQELFDAAVAEKMYREKAEEADTARSNLYMRVKEAELKIDYQVREINELTDSINVLTEQLEVLKKFEKEQTNLSERLAAAGNSGKTVTDDKYSRCTQTIVELNNDEDDNRRYEKIRHETIEAKRMEKNALEGLERVQNQLSALIEKTLKVRIVQGNASSVQLACDEMCKRLEQEKKRRHEQAEMMRKINETLEKQAERVDNQENILPPTTETKTDSGAVLKTGNLNDCDVLKSSSSSSKYLDPTRQLLYDSTQGVDAIVQKLKKTQNYGEMSPKLRAAIAQLIIDSRSVRDFLHQKLTLFKSIDLGNLKNHTYEELLQRLEKSYQDYAILEEQYRKTKKEIKSMRQVIPTLGSDVEQRIKKEIGGIARDMGAVRAVQK